MFLLVNTKCYFQKQNRLSFLKKQTTQSLLAKQYRRLKRYDILKIDYKCTDVHTRKWHLRMNRNSIGVFNAPVDKLQPVRRIMVASANVYNAL